MITTLVKWGLWQRRISIIIWSIAVAAFISMYLAFYPSFKNQSAQLQESFKQIPEAAVALFSDTGEFFSPEGYLSSQVFYFMLPLLLGILAISLGSSLLAKEERDGTIELLLSRPVSRANLLVAKATIGLVCIAVVGSVGLLTTVGLSNLVDIEVPLGYIAEATLVAILLSVSFCAVAFALSATGRLGRGMAVSVSSLVAIAGYVVGSLVGMADWLKYPAKLFPFYYYRPAEILTGTYNWNNLWYMFGLIVVSALVAHFSFRQRDIR